MIGDPTCRLKKTSAHAHWRDRLADMLVAGGTLAVVACSSSPNEPKQHDQTLVPDSGVHDASSKPPNAPVFTIPCGNANPDPCICDRPKTDPIAAIACKNKLACEAAGGAWDNPTPEGQCVLTDAGPTDAGSGD